MKMYVVEKSKGEMSSLPAKELSQKQMKAMASRLACSILKELAKEPSYAMDIAKKLNVHEQKIYYHIRKLEKARIIEITKIKNIGGTSANIYALTEPAFVIKFREFEATQRITGIESDGAKPQKFLEPFIENGQLNATIIVGSPDPHGPEKARSRDGYYGIDLALFLGTFINSIAMLNVKLDTESRADDLQNNLILIGGPVVNTITAQINSKLPVRFEEEHNWRIFSTITNKAYHTDETGIIEKIKNPFNPKKFIMVVAGKRYSGTRAVTIAFLKHFKEILKGNSQNPKISARVVEGIDLDSDGIVDEAEFLE